MRILGRAVSQDVWMSFLLLAVALAGFLLTALAPQTELGEIFTVIESYAGRCLRGFFMICFLYYIIGQIVCLVRYRKLDVGIASDWLGHHWRESRFFGIVAPFVAFSVLLASFTVFKTRVINGVAFAYDDRLIALDRMLFGGTDPWRLSHQIFASPEATAFLDHMYHSWYLPMVLAFYVSVLVIQKPAVRQCYLLSYVLSWLFVGMVLALQFASAGPAFDGIVVETGGYFSELNARLREQSDLVGPFSAMRYQDYLVDAFSAGQVRIGSGISAMPSMHIALVSLWVLAAFRLNRYFGAVVLVYGLLIWIGSFHLAWHYALDGIVSAVLVVLFWYFSEWVLGHRPERVKASAVRVS